MAGKKESISDIERKHDIATLANDPVQMAARLIRIENMPSIHNKDALAALVLVQTCIQNEKKLMANYKKVFDIMGIIKKGIQDLAHKDKQTREQVEFLNAKIEEVKTEVGNFKQIFVSPGKEPPTGIDLK